MATWSALFFFLLSTGFVAGTHPGEFVEFWQVACEKKQRKACERLVRALNFQIANGSSMAANELAIHFLEGQITEKDAVAAGVLFAIMAYFGQME